MIFFHVISSFTEGHLRLARRDFAVYLTLSQYLVRLSYSRGDHEEHKEWSATRCGLQTRSISPVSKCLRSIFNEWSNFFAIILIQGFPCGSLWSIQQTQSTFPHVSLKPLHSDNQISVRTDKPASKAFTTTMARPEVPQISWSVLEPDTAEYKAHLPFNCGLLWLKLPSEKLLLCFCACKHRGLVENHWAQVLHRNYARAKKSGSNKHIHRELQIQGDLPASTKTSPLLPRNLDYVNWRIYTQ